MKEQAASTLADFGEGLKAHTVIWYGSKVVGQLVLA